MAADRRGAEREGDTDGEAPGDSSGVSGHRGELSAEQCGRGGAVKNRRKPGFGLPGNVGEGATVIPARLAYHTVRAGPRL